VNAWVEAARPRTLVAGIVPVLVGTAAAGRFSAWRFVAALVVGISIQIAVNYANDYFDGVRGVDTSERIGPRRAVAAGLVTPVQMRTALIGVLAIGALAGLALALATTPWLLLVGVACFAALLGYSGGPRPYASAGLGEVFVFVFFGLVATAGSAFVQDERLSLLPVAAAVPVGLLAVALLVVNNLRDIATDRAADKNTLAVRLGERATHRLFDVLLLATWLGLLMVCGVARSGWPALALGALPLWLRARRSVARAGSPGALVAALGATAGLKLVFGLLLAVGLWIS
jgi:1,4-dihydroxy-2-naphthoate octaprenyltransferase